MGVLVLTNEAIKNPISNYPCIGLVELWFSIEVFIVMRQVCRKFAP
jgi:hypothetical protein